MKPNRRRPLPDNVRAPLAHWLAVLSIVAAAPVFGQGKSAVLLPEMQQTAQSLALGNGGAILNGLNSLSVNPAGLYGSRPEVLTQYQQLPLQTNLALLGASYPLRSIETSFAVTYLTLQSANFDRRDESGAASGKFSTNDQMIGLHFSRPLGAELPATIGASVKYLRLGVASESADALAFDLGGRYRLSSRPISLGFSVLNLGRGPRFSEQTSNLPTSFVMSASLQPAPGVDLLGNYTRHQAEGRQEFSVGMQYSVGGVFSIRGRYAMAPQAAGQGMGLQNLDAGVGFKLFGRHTLDYTFQPFDSSLQQSGAMGTHLVTMTMGFAEPGAAGERFAGRTDAERAGVLSARELVNEALQAARGGLFATAALRLGQAVDADPSNRSVGRMLPRVRSVASFFPSVPGGEGAAPSIRKGAQIYIYGGDAPAAAHELRSAFNLEPKNPRLLSLLRLIEREGGMELTQSSGGEPNANLVDQKISAARRAISDNRPKTALLRAREALALDPRSVVALELLGSAYYVQGDHAKARSYWQKVQELDPGNRDVATFLAGGDQ